MEDHDFGTRPIDIRRDHLRLEAEDEITSEPGCLTDQFSPTRTLKLPGSHLPETDTFDLRAFARGQPPKPSGMEMARQALLQLRRSTLTDIFELDHKLGAAKVMHNRTLYLPFTPIVLHQLSFFLSGANPIADLTVFSRIVVDHTINDVSFHDAEATLTAVGENCTSLLIISPVYTSKHGEVFMRDGEANPPANDWDIIFKSMPNLQEVCFEHAEGKPAQALGHTLTSLRRALTEAKESTQVKSIDFLAPANILSDLEGELVEGSEFTDDRGKKHISLPV